MAISLGYKLTGAKYSGWLLSKGIVPFQDKTPIIHDRTDADVYRGKYPDGSEYYYFNKNGTSYQIPKPSWSIS